MIWRIVRRPAGLLGLGLVWLIVGLASLAGGEPTCGGQVMAPGQRCAKDGKEVSYDEMASRDRRFGTFGTAIGGAMAIGGACWFASDRSAKRARTRRAPTTPPWTSGPPPAAGPAGAPGLVPPSAPYGIELPSSLTRPAAGYGTQPPPGASYRAPTPGT